MYNALYPATKKCCFTGFQALALVIFHCLLLLQPGLALSIENGTGLDFPALLEENIGKEARADGLLLMIRANRWQQSPTSHDELVRCVDDDGEWNPDRSGFGPADEVKLSGNPYGENSGYTAKYSGFFLVDEPGTWQFAINSTGPSEIEIDGRVAAFWYDDHENGSFFDDHSSRLNLSAGWHRVVFRYMVRDDAAYAEARFQSPADSTWQLLSVDNLTLKSFPAADGLQLITKKNTREEQPLNRDELYLAVDRFAREEIEYYGWNLVSEIDHADNPNGTDSNFTYRFETYFHIDASQSGDWRFSLDSGDAAELEIDDQVAVSWYDGHEPSGDTSHNATISLQAGWHRLVLRNAVNSATPTIKVMFQAPGDSSWRPLSDSELDLKAFIHDLDEDGIHNDLEGILGTGVENNDTDIDGLNDFAEAMLDANPINPDSNGDGFADAQEVAHADADPDNDGVDNLWDRDNDNDGVLDALDTSPFNATESRDHFRFKINTSGRHTALDFEIRPENPMNLMLNGKKYDWPYDTEGQMQDRDYTTEDITLVPMLEMTANLLPNRDTVDDYGITISNNELLRSFDGHFSHNDGFGVGDVLGTGNSQIVVAWDKDKKITVRDRDGNTLKQFSSVFNTGDKMAVADILGDATAEILVFNDYDSKVYVYSGEGHLITSQEIIFDKTSSVAVGDYCGDSSVPETDYDRKAEIVIGNIDSGRLWVFGIEEWDTGYHVRALNSAEDLFTEDDGLALADVDGDGKKEILVAHNVDDQLFIYRYQEGEAFAQLGLPKPIDFDRSDGLIGMDILPSDDPADPRYGEEIVVLKRSGGAIAYTEVDRATDGDMESVDYSTFDGYATADLSGDPRNEMIVASDTSGVVKIFNPATKKAYVPLAPVQDNGETVAFQGRMVYNATGGPVELDAEVRLVWFVVGKTDTEEDPHAGNPVILAKYPDPFLITGFSATEYRGETAALFYNTGAEDEARDLLTKTYMLLEHDFLNTAHTIEEAGNAAVSAGLDISRTAINEQPWEYESDKWLEERLDTLVRDTLPDGNYPVMAAGVSRTASITLSGLLASDNEESGFFQADLEDAPTFTLKSIKMNWYDTRATVVSPLDMDSLKSMADGWGLSGEYSTHSLTVMLMASMGEIGFPSYYAAPAYDLEAYLLKNGTFVKQVAMAGKQVWDNFQTTKSVLKSAYSTPSGFRNARLRWRHHYKIQTSGNFFARMLTKANIKPETANKLAGHHKLRGSALAFVTASYTFYQVGSASGWSNSGTAMAANYFLVEFSYGFALVMVQAIPAVGQVIALAIFVDETLAWLQHRESWSQKAIEWAVDQISDPEAKLPDPAIHITSTQMIISDYDNNGLTKGDRIEFRLRATETIKRYKKDDETDEEKSMLQRDMRGSYLQPRAEFRDIAGWKTLKCSCFRDILDNETCMDTVHWWGGLVNCDQSCEGADGVVYQYPKLRLCFDSDFPGEENGCVHHGYTPCVNNQMAIRPLISKTLKETGGSSRFLVDYALDEDRKQKIWDFGAWVELDRADRNVGLALLIKTDLKQYYRQCAKRVAVIESCDRVQHEQTMSSVPAVLHFDVLPATLDEFRTWRVITPLDHDDDGLNDDMEVRDDGPWFSISGTTADTGVTGHLDAGADEPDGTNDYVHFTGLPSEQGGTDVWRLEKDNDGYFLFTNEHNESRSWPAVLTAHAGSSHPWMDNDSADFSRWRLVPLRDDLMAVINKGVSESAGDELGLLVPYNHQQGDQWSAVGLDDIHGENAVPLWRISPLGGGGTRFHDFDSDKDGLSDSFELSSLIHGMRLDPLSADSDGDGLTDREELEAGTNPAARDTDDDGLTDDRELGGWQITVSYNGMIIRKRVSSDPTISDTDGDGRSDFEEFSAEMPMNPASRDTDGDGTPDSLDTDPTNPPSGTVNSDGDNLVDDTETAGWTITVTTAGGTETRNVTSDPNDEDSDDDTLLDHQEYGVSDPNTGDTDGDGLGDAEELEHGTNILHFDSDGDGLNDGEEIHTHHTDANNSDTDRDGLKDRDEIVTHHTNPLLADSDNDGLRDSVELSEGTDPQVADTDGDTLDDGAEVNVWKSDPLRADTDNDTLGDDMEVLTLHTSPLLADTDGDTMDDAAEIQYDCTPFMDHLDPLLADSDGDSISDYEEIHGSPATSPCTADTDGDGLNDSFEIGYGTDPTNNDSDGDGIDDGDEIDKYGTNPLQTDSDGDHLTDSQEITHFGTNPAAEDTDGDGIPDDLDPDTTPLPEIRIPQLLILYDSVVPRQDAIVANLREILGENNVVVDIPENVNLPDYHYILMLGLPDDQAADGTIGDMMDKLLDEQTRADMLAKQEAIEQGLTGEELDTAIIRSLRARLATSAVPAYNGLPAGGYGTMPPATGAQVDMGLADSLIVMLSEPQQYDANKIINTLVSLRTVFWENFAKTEWIPADGQRNRFTLDGIAQTDTIIIQGALEAPADAGMAALAAYRDVQDGNQPGVDNGLGAGLEPVGKYVLAEFAASIINPPALVPLQSASFRMYYEALDLDRSIPRDGDIADIGDLNENTLVVYRWNDAGSSWEQVTTGFSRHPDNITVGETEYEGFIEFTTGSEVGLFALAGIPLPDTTTPGAPAVVATVPGDNSVGIALDSEIQVTFSEPVEDANLYMVEVDGAVILDTSLSDNILTINHDGLVPGVSYQVTIPDSVVIDAAGNYNETYSWSFTAADPNNIPFANDDDLLCTEDVILSVNVMDDHGHGTDWDSEGDPLTITAVNGEAGKLGVQIPGSGGGLFILDGDGNLSFDTNGEFDDLPAMVEMHSSITYTLDDGLGSDTATVTVTILGTNSRPILSSEARNLTAIAANVGNDNGSGGDGDNDGIDNYDNPGDTVAEVIASAGTTFDGDGDSLGMAVVGVDNSKGGWQYYFDGSGWLPMNSLLSEHHALLLAPGTRIRFVPDARLNCTLTTSLNFKLWDMTSGTGGVQNQDTTLGDSYSLSGADAVLLVNQVAGLPSEGDVDGDGLQNCADPEPLGSGFKDTDGDGIDDDWELFYFNGLTRASATSDSERDRYSDYFEYLNWRDGILDPAGYGFDPTLINAPDGANFDKGLRKRGFWPLMMSGILSGSKNRQSFPAP
jgi:hypothetical protein